MRFSLPFSLSAGALVAFFSSVAPAGSSAPSACSGFSSFPPAANVLRNTASRTSSGSSNAPAASLYAISFSDGKKFTLNRQHQVSEQLELPTYREDTSVFRVLGTPIAVAGDAVMGAGVGAVVEFFLWLQMGAPACF
jgi:hypothetical protein